MDHSTPPQTGEVRRQEELVRASRDWPSWTLTPRQLGDLELILNGAFAPLTGFMTRHDAERCAREMRLADGTPFPTPILLDVSNRRVPDASALGPLVLRDPEGVAIAVLDVRDAWSDGLVGGPVTPMPSAERSRDRATPAAVADRIRRRGWTAAFAFPTRRVIDRAEHEATRDAIARVRGSGLVIVGLSDPGEDDAIRIARARCHDLVLREHEEGRALSWPLELPRRSSRSTDLLLAAIAARNAGCTHLIVTDPLDPEDDSVVAFARTLNLEVVHTPIDPKAERYMLPSVAEELALWDLPKHRRGLTLFFTGLSGSGKSTIAKLVRLKLIERTRRPVTLLDGDLVRQHLSSELGFSREHRDLNIRRIAFVASEITKHGGIAICAPIAPYHRVRHEARRTISAVGGFVLVFVDTPLEVCEARDRKGLYAKARAGLIHEFTGISDPYEPPADADVVIRTEEESAHDAAQRILAHLDQHGYLPPDGAQWAR